MLRNLIMAGMLKDVDVVHCHTWYTHLAGCLVKQLTGARLVLSTHSLEPHRPWKVEQLGTAYNASSWVERTAYENADGVIAVSAAMREDVQKLYGVPHDKIRVIHNGIDLQQYRPAPEPRGAGQVRDRPRRPVRPVRGKNHAAKGNYPSGQRDPIDPGRASRWFSAPGLPTRPRLAARWPNGLSELGVRPPTQSFGSPRSSPKDEIIALYSDGEPVRLPVGLRAVRDYQPGSDGLRDAGGGLGSGRHQRGCHTRARRGYWCPVDSPGRGRF